MLAIFAESDVPLSELQKPMDESREIYKKARLALEAMEGYDELLGFVTKKPDVRQASSDFNTFKQRLWNFETFEQKPELFCCVLSKDLSDVNIFKQNHISH